MGIYNLNSLLIVSDFIKTEVRSSNYIMGIYNLNYYNSICVSLIDFIDLKCLELFLCLSIQ